MLLEAAHRHKGPVSDKIRNAPDLLPGLELYVDAFNLLTTSRTVTEAEIGYIPYSEIILFCQTEGIEGEGRDDMLFLLGEMDSCYVDVRLKRIKKARDEVTAKAKVRKK